MKKKYLAVSLILLLAAAAVFLFCLPKPEDKQPEPQPAEEVSEPVPEPEPEPIYQSPVDFTELQSSNPDIYAWLQIPETDISYAVLQNAKNDAFYLDHNESGKSHSSGALFTEHKYNSTDFSDPVTVIYGHRLISKKMFGKLQQYYTDDFEKYSELIIYTPTEEIHYKVFAATAFSSRHILYYYDCFENELMMQEFLKDLKSVRAIGSYMDKSVEISETDQLLVLSTCLQGDRTCRFLVIGKRIK